MTKKLLIAGLVLVMIGVVLIIGVPALLTLNECDAAWEYVVAGNTDFSAESYANAATLTECTAEGWRP